MAPPLSRSQTMEEASGVKGESGEVEVAAPTQCCLMDWASRAEKYLGKVRHSYFGGMSDKEMVRI